MKYLLEQRVGTPAQQKWVTKLLGYDFTVEFKSGKTNAMADALSRLPYSENPNTEPNTTDSPTNLDPTLNLANHKYTNNPPNANRNQNQTITIQAISMMQAKWLEDLKRSYH